MSGGTPLDGSDLRFGATADANINGFHLKLTCSAFPEQYEAFKDGVQVGYLRLRWGDFSVSYPDVGGETIYEAHPQGDGFFEDEEREQFLRKAVEAIQSRLALYSL